MKKFLFTAITAALFAGCSTTKTVDPKSAPQVATQNNQDARMASNFQRRGIKVVWTVNGLQSIEVTGYAPTYGTTHGNREKAFRIAELDAKAKLRRFIQEDVSTETVVKTFSKNIEKTKNTTKVLSSDDQVEVSEEEVFADNNSGTNENNNFIARRMTQVIRNNAAGILRGVYSVNEQMVDKSTAAVTIRWDVNSDGAANSLRQRFGG